MTRKLSERWASVQLMTDNKALGEMIAELQADKLEFDSNTYATQEAGQVTIFRSPHHYGKVLEIVYGTTNDDFVQSLLEENPIFEDRTSILKARQDLIGMIEDIKEASPGRLFIECPARHRPVELRELPTIALIQILGSLVAQRG